MAAILTTVVALLAQEGAAGLREAASDGKAQRGRFPGGDRPVHVLNAYGHDPGPVLATEPICAPARTEQGEAELTVAPDRLRRRDCHGRVPTGDAHFCQRNLWATVHAAGGDDLVTVKENHRDLLQDVRRFFDHESD